MTERDQTKTNRPKQDQLKQNKVRQNKGQNAEKNHKIRSKANEYDEMDK